MGTCFKTLKKKKTEEKQEMAPHSSSDVSPQKLNDLLHYIQILDHNTVLRKHQGKILDHNTVLRKRQGKHQVLPGLVDTYLHLFKSLGSPLSLTLIPKFHVWMVKRCLHAAASGQSTCSNLPNIDMRCLCYSWQLCVQFIFKIKTWRFHSTCSIIDIVKSITYDGKYRDIRCYPI